MGAILILADAFDAHADAVAKIIQRQGGSIYRINLDVASLRSSHINFDGKKWRIKQDGQTLTSDEIRCIWPRRLTVSLDLEQQTTLEDSSFKIWRSEWNRCLYGFYFHMRDRFWMNGISQSALADNKYNQILTAKDIGFNVPNLITSNYLDTLKSFVDKNDPVVIKFMSQDIYKMENGDYAGIYVNKIKSSDLSDFSEYGENPITLQVYIEKDYEVRYTYVDGSEFCCKIESQKSDRASVDWRRYDIPNTPHFPIDPPKYIKGKVKLLMNRLNLTYGALDFVVDKQGKWWYLEVNSAGQWLWIEDLAGLPISDKVASTLITRSKGLDQ